MARQINEINIHCSATRPGWLAGQPGDQRIAEIRRWHVDTNGWRDIGYHHIIDRDGKIYHGRPETQTGAFEPKVNGTAIGVCLLGGYGSSATDEFSANYTPEQDVALRELIEDIKTRWPIKKITGHNDYSSKACPGFKVSRWLAGKPSARAFSESGTAAGSAAALVSAGGLGVAEVAAVATQETKTAVAEVQAAAGSADPLRWVLIAVIVVGAAFALYRRWQDWKAGRT